MSTASTAPAISPSQLVRRTVHSKQAKEFFCGWGAGCIETCALYPVVKLTFRQQLHGVVLREAFSQVLSEGFPLLYRGLLPPLIQRTTARMVMFGMYDSYKQMFGCEHSSPTSSISLCHASAAFLAGVTEAVLCPFERVQVLLQHSAYNSHFRNTHQAFKAVRAHGVLELYRGMSVIVLRNGLSNTVFFCLREPLKALVLSTVEPLRHPNSTLKEGIAETTGPLMTDPNERTHSQLFHMLADFLSGALLGASINTIFFPLNVIKQRMQSQLGPSFDSPRRVFRLVWRERNRSLKELFRGVELNFTRSLLTWGITNSVYELLRRLVM